MPKIRVKVHKVIVGFPAARPTADDITAWRGKWPKAKHTLSEDFLSRPNAKVSADGIYEIDADDNGVPLDHHWRRRLRDAEHDGCCEVVGDTLKPEHQPQGPGASEEEGD